MCVRRLRATVGPLLVLALVLAMFLLPRAAQAQIANVQSLIAKEKPGWSVQIEGVLDFRSWNTRQLMVGGSVIGRYTHEKSTVLLMTKGDFLRRGDAAFQTRHLEHARFRRHFLGPLDLELFAQHSTDDFRRLEHRILIGAGPRLRVIEGTPLNLSVGMLPMFEREWLGPGDKRDAGLERSDVRLSTYLLMSVALNEKVRINQSFYFQPRVDDFKNMRVLHEFETLVSVTKSIGLKWALVSMYDPKPPFKIVPLDTTLKTSLAIGF